MAVLRPEQLQDLARRRLGLQAVADTDRRRLTEDYGINSRLLEQDSKQQQINTADQLASQGLFHSGIRVSEQGRIQREANQQLADLNLQRSRGLEDISTTLAQGLAGINYEQSQALAEANRAEQERNMQRALLDAQRRAAMVGPVGYPNPVIGFGQQGGAQGIPAFVGAGSNGRNPYNSFTSFRIANPQLAAFLTLVNGGDHINAERQAVRQGYILPVRVSPYNGRRAM